MRKIDRMLANKNGTIPDFSYMELDEEKYQRCQHYISRVLISTGLTAWTKIRISARVVFWYHTSER
jgi:hypothetical protein